MAARARATDVRTLHDLLDLWLADVLASTSLSERTKIARTQQARRLDETVGRMRVGDARRAGAEHKRARQAAGKRASTIATELVALGAAWRWGVREGLVSGEGPDCKVVRAHEVEATARERYTPTADEVSRALACLDGWTHDFLTVLWLTGARRGEVSALTGASVDDARGVLRLRGKTGARDFPLLDPLAAALAPWREGKAPGARLWPVTEGSVGSTLGSHIARACKAAGVPYFTPHGLRRAAVDNLLRAGVDVGTAAALLGHSPAVMLKHYRRASEADVANAAAVLGRAAVGGRVLPFKGTRRGVVPDRPGHNARSQPAEKQGGTPPARTRSR